MLVITEEILDFTVIILRNLANITKMISIYSCQASKGDVRFQIRFQYDKESGTGIVNLEKIDT